MHRSRLGGIIIDCRTDDLEGAAAFWLRALGYGRRPSTRPEYAAYVVLDTGRGELDIEVQKVAHPSRVHLDIETDDVAAEVRRLEALGARRVAAIHDWVVMEAPTGQRFCVVPVGPDGFAGEPNVWD